jgi:hypothetical protein
MASLPADDSSERLAREIAATTAKPLATVVREAIAEAESVGIHRPRRRLTGQEPSIA